MELSRREALAVLGGAGAAAGAASLGADLLDLTAPDREAAADQPLSSHDRGTAIALAGVLYPSVVSGVDRFVETYLRGLAADRPGHAGSIAAAVDALDDFTRTWWGRPYVDLPADLRERAPSEMGLATTRADPEGIDRQRVRYYLVDELLYALYASPTGGELLGIENPPGHPGGLESYRRGPSRE